MYTFCIILYYIILHYITLYYIYYIILYYIILYYIVLYYIVLYYIVLYYIVLYLLYCIIHDNIYIYYTQESRQMPSIHFPSELSLPGLQDWSAGNCGCLW